MMTLFPEDINENITINSEYPNKRGKIGTNQKKSGELLENKVYNYIRCKYPNSYVKREVAKCGSYKKSKRTGKFKRKMNKIDIMWDNIAISCKNQLTGGTAEQKITHELCVLKDCLDNNKDIEKIYIIYEGEGFKIIDEEYKYLPVFEELRIILGSKIEIISYAEFVERY